MKSGNENTCKNDLQVKDAQQKGNADESCDSDIRPEHVSKIKQMLKEKGQVDLLDLETLVREEQARKLALKSGLIKS